jgi:uncharacterized protein (TIGR02145 family)
MKTSAKFIPLLIICLLLNSCKEDKGPTEPRIPPQIPVLSSPINDATEVAIPITLSWNASNGAKSYGLQISADSLFTTVAYDTNRITTTNKDISILNNTSKYYWRVNATNEYGTSGWSIIWNFTTMEPVMNIPCPGISTVDYAGNTYNTVQIGNQCWFKENLDIGTMIQGRDTSKDNGIIEKYCYDDDTANCNIYGGLYQWTEAIQYNTGIMIQGICPPGWHISTRTEFQALVNNVGGNGNALKAIGQGINSGAGTNTSGFSALLAGYRWYSNYFSLLDSIACFWSSTGDGSMKASFMILRNNEGNITLGNNDYYTDYSFNIRCIKDY